MTPDFAQWLLSLPEGQRTGKMFILRGRHGRPLTTAKVGRIVARIGEKAGVVVDKTEAKFATAHDLRRSFGTRWSKRVKTATLQRLMRHAYIKTTLAYYVDQDADDVAADLWTDHGPNRPKSPAAGNTSGNPPILPSKSKTRRTPQRPTGSAV